MWDETEDPDYLYRTDPCYADRLARHPAPRCTKEHIWQREQNLIPKDRRVYSHKAKAWFGIVNSDWRQDMDEYRRRMRFPVDRQSLWMPEWWDGWVCPSSLPDWD
jgi:hypothetical protein